VEVVVVLLVVHITEGLEGLEVSELEHRFL
jgi:hypothetical protein